MTKVKVASITYANEKYIRAAKLNIKTAKRVGKVDKVFLYSPKDIEDYFRKSHENILKCEKGNGYWLWKPYFIKKTLENLDEGEILIYTDATIIYRRGVQSLIDAMEQNHVDKMIFALGNEYIDARYTKRDAFILMDCDEEKYYNTPQVNAAMIVLKKNKANMEFCTEWLKYASDQRVLTDIPNTCGKDNYPGFLIHRHDQSILSLLAKRYNCMLFADPSQWRQEEEYSLDIKKRSNYPCIFNHHRIADANSIVYILFMQTEIGKKIVYKRSVKLENTLGGGKRCPICNSTGKRIRSYTKNDYVIGYGHMYNEKVSRDMFATGYSLFRCQKCDLVYADPLKAGSDEFYTWVTNHEGYYPTKEAPRWEWKQTVKWIRKYGIRSILEIGCGEGAFLEYCKVELGSIECIGVDMTKSSCDKAAQKGLTVFCGTIEDYLDRYPDKKFDVVVSFHCLEHVNDPKKFVQGMLKVCGEKGVCINSFPYSDLLIEPWMDCNNLPPHHMTRWCEKACRELGRQLDASVELVSPQPLSVYQYTKQTLINLWFPLYLHKNVNRRKLLVKCLMHLITVLREIHRNMRRDYIYASKELSDKPMHRRADQVIMMILKKK